MTGLGTSKAGDYERKQKDKGSSLRLTYVRQNVIYYSMSRPLRIEYLGAWYHVMNRGRRSESIFSDKHDYLMFIDLLIEVSEMSNVNVASFCLISKHTAQ